MNTDIITEIFYITDEYFQEPDSAREGLVVPKACDKKSLDKIF